MPKEKRPNVVKVHLSDEELKRIDQKLGSADIQTLSAYFRNMGLNGYILKLDLPEIRELISLLRNMTNNLNQLTKRVNSGGKLYETELLELNENQNELWNLLKQILKLLEGLN